MSADFWHPGEVICTTSSVFNGVLKERNDLSKGRRISLYVQHQNKLKPRLRPPWYLDKTVAVS